MARLEIKEQTDVIHAADLSMHYGPRVALEGASFDVEPGEVVGLLGPNGAGKSTTMKILTTYLYPTRGTATVGGKSVRNEPLAVRRLIGYLPEVLPLYPEMRAGAYLNFVGRARGLRGARLRQRRAWVEERCGLEGVGRQLIRELSKGYQQRVGLAQALIHDPQVVILDEPTSSLDPYQILAVRELVWDLAADGKTVLLSTHILQEVEAVADRLVIINQGRIVGQGTLEDLRQGLEQYERTSLSVAAPQQEVETALNGMPGLLEVRFINVSDGYAMFDVWAPAGRGLTRQIGNLLCDKGWRVGELHVQPPTLEETFLALTAPPASDEAPAAHVC
jgi:ABC-2 type transport system ATP-binding protein